MAVIYGARLIPARIKQARKAMPLENGRPVSQNSLANKLGVHWTTVSSWERGANAPEEENLHALAEVTDQPLEFFFRPTADGPPPESGGTAGAAERLNGGRAAGRVPSARRGEEGD